MAGTDLATVADLVRQLESLEATLDGILGDLGYGAQERMWVLNGIMIRRKRREMAQRVRRVNGAFARKATA